jgi:hypothetical protein
MTLQISPESLVCERGTYIVCLMWCRSAHIMEFPFASSSTVPFVTVKFWEVILVTYASIPSASYLDLTSLMVDCGLLLVHQQHICVYFIRTSLLVFFN